MNSIPFQNIDWSAIEKVEYKGEKGNAYWQTVRLGGLRIRIVEYSPGYWADHWCKKGHLIHCLEGEFTTELSTEEKLITTKGNSWIVSDELSLHRSTTKDGVKLLIIDGEFLG